MIKENLLVIQNNIKKACERSNRNYNEVTLIAVSKTKPIEMIQEALQNGMIHFGENKVQELNEKQKKILKPIIWHFIGHLQRNKVKYLVGDVNYIHSVDSLRLAEQIESECVKKNVTCKILIEVNISGEDTKFGVSKEELPYLVYKVSHLKHIELKGLMTIAPYVLNPENNRVHFRNLRKLLVDINNENIDNVNMNELSMGMTGDYEIAIEEGATMVRVGTGIFGERHYNL